ncbi:MAG: trans-2,3-dihydro-3-hydroxyanthranilate isomerase [Blastocatellia bacterium]|nr:trans-2,3-dihydro-3-hydroxyanthranilate isomerase [Blastocatellia bacterium]
MHSYNFFQLDVFTDHAFGGNPLAVFPEAEGISDEQMQQIAREMNLSETVFVLPSEKEEALRRLRIFTPGNELPFAGHPIVGTWNCLARKGIVPLPENGNGWVHLKHEVGIGVLPIDIEFKDGEPAQVVMTQGKFEIRGEIDDAHDQSQIARALGLAREDLDESLPIQAVSTGNTMLLAPVRSLADLGNCKVNLPMLSEIYEGNSSFAGSTGCYAFTRETLEIGEARAHARFFIGQNIGEDPATGSAAGPLGGYLVYHDATRVDPVEGVYKFVIEQGDFINRPSRIGLQVTGEPGKVDEVRVSGKSVLVARGVLEF